MRHKTIRASALNLTVHPHKPHYYTDILTRAFELESRCNGPNETVFILGDVSKTEEGCEGMLYRFTNLDAFNWYDENTHNPAETKEVGKVSIPDYLKANLKQYAFVLNNLEHVVVIQEYANGDLLSTVRAVSVFEKILNHPNIIGIYNQVDVQSVKDESTIEKILQTPNIVELYIKVSLPNSDGHEKSQNLEDQLKAQNVKQKEVILKARDDSGIKFDEETETTTFLRASKKHGEAKAKTAFDKGNVISTKKTPYIDKIFYNPKVTEFKDAFKSLASKMIEESKLFNTSQDKPSQDKPSQDNSTSS